MTPRGEVVSLPSLLTTWLELENFPRSPAGSSDAPSQDDQNKRNLLSPLLYHRSWAFSLYPTVFST